MEPVNNAITTIANFLTQYSPLILQWTGIIMFLGIGIFLFFAIKNFGGFWKILYIVLAILLLIIISLSVLGGASPTVDFIRNNLNLIIQFYLIFPLIYAIKKAKESGS